MPFAEYVNVLFKRIHIKTDKLGFKSFFNKYGLFSTPFVRFVSKLKPILVKKYEVFE